MELMRIDPAGWPFIGGSLILAILAALFFGGGGAVLVLILTCFFLFFFRDPERSITKDADAVISPADGRVMVAGVPTGEACPAGNWQQISIFLSPMDVHVNRMPIGGRVTKVEYHPGRFLPAYRADAGDLTSTPRSRSTITDSRSSSVRSSACWRGASSAASRKATSCTQGTGSGS